VAVNVALAFTCVWLFTFVVGSWDPTFSHSAAAGAGYTASAFIVLIGFYGFAFAAASWTGYPFENETAPTSSLAQWFMAAFITVVGVVVLVYPNFNLHLVGNAPLKLVDALGWYSSIVVVIVAAQLWENWPWAGVGNRPCPRPRRGAHDAWRRPARLLASESRRQGRRSGRYQGAAHLLRQPGNRGAWRVLQLLGAVLGPRGGRLAAPVQHGREPL
jgi:hypothetical protein